MNMDRLERPIDESPIFGTLRMFRVERIPLKLIPVAFFRLGNSREPVRDWLQALDKDCRHAIGHDIKTVQVGWPLGMPLVRKLDNALWEIRSDLPQGRIARVLFTMAEGKLVLLHGFIKKAEKTPLKELALAKQRRNSVLEITHEQTYWQ